MPEFIHPEFRVVVSFCMRGKPLHILTQTPLAFKHLHSSHHTRKLSSPRKLADPNLKDLMTKLWNLTSFISKDFMCIWPCCVLSSGLLVPRWVTKAKTMFVFRLCHLRAVCRGLAKSVFVYKDSPEISAMVSSEPRFWTGKVKCVFPVRVQKGIWLLAYGRREWTNGRMNEREREREGMSRRGAANCTILKSYWYVNYFWMFPHGGTQCPW